jgi:lipopolysaccharide transport system permease protein
MATIITGQPDRIAPYLNPIALLQDLWRRRSLIRQFTQREIQGEYRGSFLGLLWSLVHPLVLLGIYTFVFGVVFNRRWPGTRTNSLSEFALVLFCGLTIFNIFGESANRAPRIILKVPNYVKKVVFPLEILPVCLLGTVLFHTLIRLAILLAATLIVHGYIPWTVVLLPLAILPILCLGLGLSWFLASLGVFIRDISYTISLIVQVIFFLTPIFYPISAVPKGMRPLLTLNPLTPIIDNCRQVLLWGAMPDWVSLGAALVVSMSLMLLGYAWFMKTKKAFADVL